VLRIWRSGLDSLGGERGHSASWAQFRSCSREIVAAPVYGRRGSAATPLYPQKLALTSQTSVVWSVGIVRSQTKVTEFVSFVFMLYHLLGWPSSPIIQRRFGTTISILVFFMVIAVVRGPLSLVSATEKLLQRKSGGFCLENREYCRRESAALTMRHPSIRKSWH
jgi:hypothetical protein